MLKSMRSNCASISMTYRDVLQLAKILVLGTIAWCVSPRFWRKIASGTARIGQVDNCWPVYNVILGRKYSKAEICHISKRRRSYSRELKIQILGLNGPWRGWRPDIRLNGEVNLQKAVEGGCGVILWVTETVFSTLIVKMALDRAGYHACQLSRPGHGFSLSSSFGIRYLNPIWIRVEDRFIAERVVIAGETATEELAVLRARLGKNGVVIITVVPLAHKFVEVPFFQGHLQLPTGPVQLALKTGAVLLPVFAFTKQNGGFEVLIDQAINPADGSRRALDIAAAYARRLEPFVMEHPDQWTGWDWLGSWMRIAGWKWANETQVS